MRRPKDRVTLTLDPALIAAGAREVRAGRAASFSAWVNAALAERVAKERRLAALGELIADYERRHGPITDEALEAQRRADRRNAIAVRREPRRGAKRKRVA